MELFAQNESFYSQRAMLALKAKGVNYTLKEMNMNEFDHLQPWYLKINPSGLIPTLKHGDKYIPDSSAILFYIDNACEGPKLLPDQSTELGKNVKQLYDKVEAVDARMLTLGTIANEELRAKIEMPEELQKVSQKHHIVSGRNIEAMEKLMAENPDLKEIYSTKLERAKKFNVKAVFTKENRQRAIERTNALFDEIEVILKKSYPESIEQIGWLFGDGITAADVGLLVLLQRLSNLGLGKEMWIDRLPKLNLYFQYAKDNFPGYKDIASKGF